MGHAKTVTYKAPGGKMITKKAMAYWLDDWAVTKKYGGITYRPEQPVTCRTAAITFGWTMAASRREEV